MFFQKYLLFVTTRFHESVALTRLTKTRLWQNQRIMELKIELRERFQNPIARIVHGVAPTFGRMCAATSTRPPRPIVGALAYEASPRCLEWLRRTDIRPAGLYSTASHNRPKVGATHIFWSETPTRLHSYGRIGVLARKMNGVLTIRFAGDSHDPATPRRGPS